MRSGHYKIPKGKKHSTREIKRGLKELNYN